MKRICLEECIFKSCMDFFSWSLCACVDILRLRQLPPTFYNIRVRAIEDEIVQRAECESNSLSVFNASRRFL